MAKFIVWGIVLAVHFLVFLSLGTLVMKTAKKEEYTLSMAVITGYFAYFGLFEVIALPMVFLQRSLTFLSYVMAGILGIAVLCALFHGLRHWLGRIASVPEMIREHSLFLLILFGVVLFQCYFVAIYYDSSADAGYYVGMASTSVYTDTLGTYNPYTGGTLKYFVARYVFSCFPLHNAFVSRISGVPAIIQAKTIMAVANVLIANMVYYQIGRRLFDKRRRIYADLLVLFLFVINLYCSSIYHQASFFFRRMYEGKTILASIVFPMILYCSIRLYQDDRDRMVWISLFLCNLAAVSFSGTAIIGIFACAAGLLPVIVLRRRYKLLLPLGVSVLPLICWGAVYTLAMANVISLRIS